MSARVLVIGGGPVGLTASLLLSKQGIENVVVERRDGTLRAPAAHVLRRRPMAVFARLGVAEDVLRAAPDLPIDVITWCATFAGPDVGRLDVSAASPSPLDQIWTNCPQNLLEPVLLAHAERQAPARILRGRECVAIEQDGKSVRARICVPGGHTETVEADWAIAADGAGSPTRRRLGIPMVGDGPQGRFFMTHFRADLRPWLAGRSGPLFWIMNPESPGTVIVHEPERSHVFMAMQRGEPGERDALPARLRAALGTDVPFEIVSIDEWSPHVQVAERYREGRVFLAGDAAHRFPPSGGLGLNTGILDAEHLCHHLADVIAGRADESALDRYEAACRPAAQANAEASFGNLLRLAEIPKALGPCADLAALKARLASLNAEERRALDAAIELQRDHFVSDGHVPEAPLSS